MRSSEPGSRLQRATLWLVIALLALVALMPADRVLVCLCPVDGMELALGRGAQTACHGVEDGADVAPGATELLPAPPPEGLCAHLEIERAPWTPASTSGAEVPVAQGGAAAEPRLRPVPPLGIAALVIAPPDPPPTALPRLRRCTVFLV